MIKNQNEDFVKSVSEKIEYIFEKNDEKLFHRTRLLNEMTKKTKTNIVVNYDVDVIFKIEDYVECREKVFKWLYNVFSIRRKFL